MATIKLYSKRTNNADSTFTVFFELKESVGIPLKIFVKSKDTGLQSHVANIFELETVPEAVTPTATTYRDYKTEKTFDSVVSAIKFLEDTTRRVKDLVESYSDAISQFPGESTNDIP